MMSPSLGGQSMARQTQSMGRREVRVKEYFIFYPFRQRRVYAAQMYLCTDVFYTLKCGCLNDFAEISLITLLPGAELSNPAAWHLPHVCCRAL